MRKQSRTTAALTVFVCSEKGENPGKFGWGEIKINKNKKRKWHKKNMWQHFLLRCLISSWPRTQKCVARFSGSVFSSPFPGLFRASEACKSFSNTFSYPPPTLSTSFSTISPFSMMMMTTRMMLMLLPCRCCCCGCPGGCSVAGCNNQQPTTNNRNIKGSLGKKKLQQKMEKKKLWHR